MKFNYLGHSEFLLEIQNPAWKMIKILSDSWLSDYALWDLMARYPKIEIDYEKFEVDVIFLSHSHSDHLDPYTLIQIYEHLKPRPLLLIPETLGFLEPLFKKYLPKQKVKILKNREIFEYEGIEFEGIIFENEEITNEDDVMTIAISNQKELLYAEIDTLPPENIETLELLYEVFTRKKYETALYLGTRNELEGNFKILDAKSTTERKKIQKEYLLQRTQEIEYSFYRFEDEFAWVPDIQTLPSFVKWYIWQGIIHPNPEFLKLRILKLDQIVKIENSFGKKYGKIFPITYFEPGKSYIIEKKEVQGAGAISFLKNFTLDDPETNLDTEIYKQESLGPLDERKGNFKAQEQKILQMLNTKFLPYQLGNIDDNLKNILLNSKNHRYIIKIKYGNSQEYFERNYYFDFWSFGFQEEKGKHEWYNEDYWANDVEDFLDGRQELYSNFWHTLNPTKAYRVWTCLGANFLNNDLVYKKYELHFKRAAHWESVNSFVMKYIKDLID